METGPQRNVSSDRLMKPGIEPSTPGSQGKWLIHYTTAAPTLVGSSVVSALASSARGLKFDSNSRRIFRVRTRFP